MSDQFYHVNRGRETITGVPVKVTVPDNNVEFLESLAATRYPTLALKSNIYPDAYIDTATALTASAYTINEPGVYFLSCNVFGDHTGGGGGATNLLTIRAFLERVDMVNERVLIASQIYPADGSNPLNLRLPGTTFYASSGDAVVISIENDASGADYTIEEFDIHVVYMNK